MKNKRMWIASIIFFLTALLVLVFVIGHSGQKKEKKVKVGFIINGSANESGWNGMNYEGMKKACEKLNVELLVKENVMDNTGMCPAAIDELVDEGAQMIVLVSYNYCAESIETINKYPNVIFYVNAYDQEADNIRKYFIRYYQGRYLAGVIAGKMTNTNKIGYVAAYDTDEVNRGISSFALGVKRVNSDAEVVVYYTDSWDDETKEKAAVDELIASENIDVVTCHQNRDNVVREADENGIYSIGYHQKSENVSDKFLTAVVCDWELTYEEIISQFLSGRIDEKVSWMGIDKNTVKLTDYSPLVDSSIIEEVDRAIVDMKAGRDVFTGLIYDNDGNNKCGEGEIISDDNLLNNFDWLVEGVRVYEK